MSSASTLFERIMAGRPFLHQSQKSSPERAEVLMSVAANLQRIFSGQRGAALASPSFGLPERPEDPSGRLLRPYLSAVAQAVRENEPRLDNVFVRILHSPASEPAVDEMFSARLGVQASLRGSNRSRRFDWMASFALDGTVDVEPGLPEHELDEEA